MKLADLNIKIKTEELNKAKVGLSMKTSSNMGVNTSYKVEAKEIPKLPPNKTLRRQIFDNWLMNFYAKICQAQVGSILVTGYTKPDEFDNEYDEYTAKESCLKNHLLAVTQNTNPGAWMNARTMDGLDMYRRLLEVFQGGEEYNEDAAVNAVELWEDLKCTQETAATCRKRS